MRTPPDNRLVDGSPGGDIHRRHPVGVVGASTRPANEFGLRPPVPSLLNRCPRPDAFKVFEGNRGAVPLGFLHQPPGDGVVGRRREVSFLAGQFPQVTFGRLRATLLEASPELGIAQTDPREGFAGEALAGALGGQVDLPHVNPENAFGVYGFRVVHFANNGQVELFLADEQPGGQLANRAFEGSELPFSCREWDLEATLERGDGDQTLAQFQAENTAIVANGTKLLEGTAFVPIPPVRVALHHLADHVDGELRWQSEAVSDAPIDEPVKRLSVKPLPLPGYCGGVVAGANGVSQGFRLSLIRHQFDDRRQSYSSFNPLNLTHREEGGVKSGIPLSAEADSLLPRFL